MKRLFFIVCCILALDICLAEDWWQENFIVGAHWGPPLHYKYDNLDSPLVRNLSLLKDGGFNFIVGQMNHHNNKATSFLNANKESLIVECHDSGFFFLVEPKDSITAPESTFGFNIKDEPSPQDASKWLDTLRSLKQRYHDKLGFINLYPSYWSNFNSYNDWIDYVDAYLGDATLQVACFDNYYPNSEFSSYPSSSSNNYFANLAYMKQLAGSRPLWAYLRCSEIFVEEKDTAWQDAYIRLGAFAPLAFGAKGIIYFCYDCKDRNKILRSPGRTAWQGHDMYFNNEEKSRQIFFGNLKRDSTSLYPDLAVHTNDSLGTWRIKETSNTGTETDDKQITIGTWFGDHINNIPNLFNWDFTSDGYDKFTTITRQGRLHLSMFRNGWTHYSDISNFPTAYWSTMSRHTCPFGDFNGNKQFDYCLGWTENGHGKLWILMDCHLDPAHTPTPRNNPMLFDDTSQLFTFGSPIKQVIARRDSTLYVITSNPDNSYTNSDSIYVLEYSSNHFNFVDTARIVLKKKIDHYWMEERLCGQSNDGDVWEESDSCAFNLTRKNADFSAGSIYLWGQYNTRSHQYDRYAFLADWRAGVQTYALLNRKGNPNRIYYTAQAINQFINDSIRSIIMDNEWLGAYFTSAPNQSVLDSSIVIKIQDNNPLPLIYKNLALSEAVLFGLFREADDYFDLLVINMREFSRNLALTIDRQAELPQLEQHYQHEQYTFQIDRIIRMNNSTDNTISNINTQYTTIWFNNMLGGECAILRLKIIPNS